MGEWHVRRTLAVVALWLVVSACMAQQTTVSGAVDQFLEALKTVGYEYESEFSSTLPWNGYPPIYTFADATTFTPKAAQILRALRWKRNAVTNPANACEFYQDPTGTVVAVLFVCVERIPDDTERSCIQYQLGTSAQFGGAYVQGEDDLLYVRSDLALGKDVPTAAIAAWFLRTLAVAEQATVRVRNRESVAWLVSVLAPHSEGGSTAPPESAAAWHIRNGYPGMVHSDGDVSVKGYYRKDGTYVRPHTRHRPNR